MKPYRTIEPGAIATSVYEDRKSRFSGFLSHVESEEAAVEFRHVIREQVPDASHYVSAYIIHDIGLEHYSDAKEPHGTAGLPVLNVLKGHELEDVVCVVARVFGGTLLGKGGLMRAYTKTASDAADAAHIVVRTPCRRLVLSIPYPLYEPLKVQLARWGVKVTGEDFAADVTLDLIVRCEDAHRVEEDIVEASNASAELVWGDEELCFLE